jgi:NADP-dependent 3-hydroxy acid dehydrogenase YdfG
MTPGWGLEGRTALVTGAATGIGRATALRLAQAGATVWVNHLGQADAADALVREIALAGGDAQAIDADVSDAAAVQAMADAVGAVDVLVNNAGIIQEKAFLDTTEADWDRLLGRRPQGRVPGLPRVHPRHAVQRARGPSSTSRPTSASSAASATRPTARPRPA